MVRLHALLLLAGARILLSHGLRNESLTNSAASCPVLVDPSREIECILNEQKVKCDKPIIPGTKAVGKCNELYVLEDRLADFESTCQSDGTWSKPMISCIPKCGERNPSIIRIRGYHYWWYLADKSNSTLDVPWHAGIYRNIDDKMQQVCGATIISERAIVTAAHCVSILPRGLPRDPQEFKVAVGKVYSDWFKDEENAQFLEVDRILIHPRFRGHVLNWANNIAVVKLKGPIEMRKSVRPICVDYSKEHSHLFLPGNIGVVAGWGIRANGTRREKVRQLTLPYINIEQCEREVPESFRQYITVDKFCVGYRNGTSLCPGDSGGGYAALFNNGKWYLMGIVSNGVQAENGEFCNLFHYTTMTRVSDFYSFIEKAIS